MKMSRWRKLQIQKTEKTLFSSSKSSAEDKWIAMNKESFKVGKMPLTEFKPSDRLDDPFVALKAKLDKAVLSFEISFVATVYMFPPIANIDAVKPKDFLISHHNKRVCRKLKKKSRQTNSYPAHIGVQGNDHFQAAGLEDMLPTDFSRTSDYVLKSAMALHATEGNVEKERKC